MHYIIKGQNFEMLQPLVPMIVTGIYIVTLVSIAVVRKWPLYKLRRQCNRLLISQTCYQLHQTRRPFPDYLHMNWFRIIFMFVPYINDD